MSNRAKMKKAVVGVLVLAVVLIVGVQVFLAYGLTDSIRKWVLPIVIERLNLDVAVDRVSVNLLAGAVTVHGIQIANPQGFEEADLISVSKCSLDIGLLALLGGGITEIQSVSARDAHLIVVRNRDGQVNIQEVSETLQRASSGAPRASATENRDEPQDSAEEHMSIPNFKVDNMEAQFQVQYVDHKLFKDPFRLSAEIDLRLKNLANYGKEDSLSGTVNLRGNIMADRNMGRFNLDGMIGPVIDPTRMTFVASGSIEGVDLYVFKAIAEEGGLKDGSVSGTLNLQCDNGVFDSAKSELRLTFHDIRFTEQVQAKMQGLGGLESFTIMVPVEGTLINPQIDIKRAIEQSLLSDEVITAILKVAANRQSGLSGSQEGGADVGDQNGKKPERGKSLELDIERILRDLRGDAR